MAAEPRPRRPAAHLARALLSLLYLVPLAVPILVVLSGGPPDAALIKDQREVDFGPPATPTVTTDYGAFEPGHTATACRRFDLDDIGPDDVISIQSLELAFTSPASNTPSGGVSWLVLSDGQNAQPGVEIASGDYQIQPLPPNFSAFATYSVQIPSVELPAGTPAFFVCARTTNMEVHIASFNSPGQSVFASFDGSPLQQIPDQDFKGRLVVDVEAGIPAPLCDLRLFQVGSGQGNAFFDTNYTLFVPEASADTQVLVNHFRRGGGSFSPVTDFGLAPGDMVEFLHSTYDTNHFGQGQDLCKGLPKLAGVSQPLLSQAVVFARQPDGREFGQYFQAQGVEEAQQAGETSLLFTTHDPGRYRVNVGVAAAADGTRVQLRALGSGGVELAAPPVIELDHDGESAQVNDIDIAWNLGGTPDVMVEVTVLAGAAFPYGSVLDGHGSVPGTSDPTTVLPVTTGAPRIVLLEMGRITGLSEFSGSASLFNHAGGPVTVNASFYQRGMPGVRASTSFQVSRRSVKSWDDVVGDLFGITGVVGAVVFETGGPRPTDLSAIGREFAIYSANGAITGTAGQLLPGLSAADQLRPGQTFDFIGLRDRQQPLGRERSHLGALNLTDSDVTMTVRSYADDDTFEGAVTETVRAGEQLRINNVLSAANPSQDGGLKRIEVTADGPLYVLAYRVNANGDPVTLGSFRR